jgi:hypothetical protein
MKILYTIHPKSYLTPEPMTDPPWIRSPFSERGLRAVSGPP